MDNLAAAFGTRRRDDLLAALAAADVPAGPVNTVSEALTAMGGDAWIEELDGVRMPPSAIRLNDRRLPVRLSPPRLGEHTGEVLDALGTPESG